MALSNLADPGRDALLASLATLRRRLGDAPGRRALVEALRGVRSYSELESIPPATPPRQSGALPVSGQLAIQLEGVASLSLDARPRSILITRDTLKDYSRMMVSLLRRAGVRTGGRLAVIDYTTALPTLVASRYCNALGVPGLEEGLGVSVACCDGVADLLSRALYVVESLSPRFVLIRSELLNLSQWGTETKASEWRGSVPPHRVIVTYDEDAPPVFGAGEGEFSLLPRADGALFSSLVVRGALLYDRSRFIVEVVSDERGIQVEDEEPGYLCVTRLFSPEACAIRYVTRLEGFRKGRRVFLSG